MNHFKSLTCSKIHYRIYPIRFNGLLRGVRSNYEDLHNLQKTGG